MDLKALRDAALEEATRFFQERDGYLPDEDSEEWEAAYRRFYDQIKRLGVTPTVPPVAAPASAAPARPELSGAPAQKRWAAGIREERLAQIQPAELRDWLAGAWLAAKIWIDTAEVEDAAFLRRVQREYGDHLRKSKTLAVEQSAEQAAKLAAAEKIRLAIAAAGLTAAGLIELVDLSPRATPLPLKAKLVELTDGGRWLRVFATADPGILMVIDKGDAGRTDYAIESDAGLVADFTLFASGNAI
jgi:hypothetical protein